MAYNQHRAEKDNQETKGETISELAHRHLLNKNHHTTDEELRNARIEYDDSSDAFADGLSELSDADNTTVVPPLPFEKDSDATNDDTDKNTSKGSPPNPYNVLK